MKNVAKIFSETVLANREKFIANAFSLQMLHNLNATIKVTEVKELPQGLKSAVGHSDTASVLGYPVNRINVSLKEGDTLYVVQLIGGRLPEGSTSLPEGFSFKYLKVEVLFKKITMCIDLPEGSMLDYSREMETYCNISLEDAYNRFKRTIETSPVLLNQDDLYYQTPV